MLFTGFTSAGSDLSKQALLHINIYRCVNLSLLSSSQTIYVALQKPEKFYVGLRLHELAVLYNPPRLKGFPNFPSLPPLSISVLSRLTSRVRVLTFNSHQRFRFHQFLWNFHLLCTGAIFLRYPSEAASQRVAEAWFPQNWNKFASHDGFFISGWITLYIN